MTLPKPRSSRRGLPLGFYVRISCRAGRQARPRAAFHIPSLLVASQGSTSRWLQQPCPRVPNGWGQPLDPFFPSPLAQKKKSPLKLFITQSLGTLDYFMLCHHPTRSSEPRILPRSSSLSPFTSSELKFLFPSWQCSYARCVCHSVHGAEVREI